MTLPKQVTLIEVGPRDGFQFETKIIPTDLKIEIITELADAGIRHIQVTSFVHPRRVPQMADAEELIEQLPKKEGVIYTALALNKKGVERAYHAGLKYIEASVSASDTHSRKNTGLSLNQAFEQGKEMITFAKKYNMKIILSIQCAFGCVYEGKIPEERVLAMAKDFMAQGIDRLSLADTTGMANPLSIKRIIEKLIPETGGIPVSLHLHDTRGLGLANVMAGMECGITYFDTALAGMGGCPFVTGAAGNIATEDTAYLMQSMQIETGIDISKVAVCSRRLAEFIGKSFPGKVYHSFD